MSYDFERVPDSIVKDWAYTSELVSETGRNIARELLVQRSQNAAAEAQATALHAIIMRVMRKNSGPESISDFEAWVNHELGRWRKEQGAKL